MKYTIRELEKQFKDFDSSELIARLVDEGYEDEVTEEEIEVEVDLLDEEQKAEYYDSSGYSWSEALAEARQKKERVFSVSDKWHTWSMGLVTEK
jgi:hypothetical protein